MGLLEDKFSTVKKENKQLLEEKKALRQNYDNLQTKYQALLQEKSSANQVDSRLLKGAFFN